jgi:ferric-dicitrate binding protein FerR (iron transport regulator)
MTNTLVTFGACAGRNPDRQSRYNGRNLDQSHGHQMDTLIDRRTLLLGVSFLAVAETDPCRAAPRVGAVMAAAGSAFLERNSSRMPAAGGADVLLDDLALTGDASRMDLRLGRATRIKLGARSQLKIDRFIAGASADVELLDGPAFVDHGPGAEPGFTLTSPYALIAARGTGFFAGPSAGVFGVFVRNGRVEVRTRAGSVRLRAGEGTDIAAPGAAPTPPKRWGDPRIAAALASVS